MTRNSAATALTKNQIAATVPMIRPTTEYNSFDEYKYGSKVLPISRTGLNAYDIISAQHDPDCEAWLGQARATFAKTAVMA
jgi:hypothetical protein